MTPPAAERWVARTRGSLFARGAAKLVPFLPLAAAVGVADGGIQPLEVVVLAVLAVLSAIATLALWRHGRRSVDIVLEGTRLTITGRGDHELSRGSLHAARWASGTADSAIGSIVFVRLGTAGIALAIPSLLPDASYASDASTGGELFVEADGDADRLLGRLRPFLMPRDLAADPGAAPTYSILLRGEPARALYIAGDTLSVTDPATRERLASARVGEVAATAYSYAHAVSERAPMPRCPGLLITFVSNGVAISVGAPPPEYEERWAHLPEGPRPDYEVGYAELTRLMDVLAVSGPN